MRMKPVGRGPGTVPASGGSSILVADGTDQSANWLALLAATPDGTLESPATINLPAGNYRFDSGCPINARNHLRIIGPTSGTPFVAYSDTRSDDLGGITQIGFDMTRCTNVVVSFVEWRGPNDQDDASNPGFALYDETMADDHAFAIRSGSVDCGYEDVTGSNAYGDGVYIGFHNDGVANQNVWVKRSEFTHCGRQGAGITHVDGGLLEDSTFDWCGRSGLDIEPNHQFDKVWDFTVRRCSMGSQFYPWIVGGASNGALPQRKNVTLEDCTTIRCASNHPAVLANRAPCDGTLTITGLTDVRNSNIYGIVCTGSWPTAVITGCEVTTSRNTPTSYAVQTNVTDSLTVTNNIFNGKPGQEGFDQLLEELVVAAVKVTGGNVWAMGTQSD